MITSLIELNLAGLTFVLLFHKIFVSWLLGDGRAILFCHKGFFMGGKKAQMAQMAQICQI
jgi:hypothetical protein